MFYFRSPILFPRLRKSKNDSLQIMNIQQMFYHNALYFSINSIFKWISLPCSLKIHDIFHVLFHRRLFKTKKKTTAMARAKIPFKFIQLQFLPRHISEIIWNHMECHLWIKAKTTYYDEYIWNEIINNMKFELIDIFLLWNTLKGCVLCRTVAHCIHCWQKNQRDSLKLLI